MPGENILTILIFHSGVRGEKQRDRSRAAVRTYYEIQRKYQAVQPQLFFYQRSHELRVLDAVAVSDIYERALLIVSFLHFLHKPAQRLLSRHYLLNGNESAVFVRMQYGLNLQYIADKRS